MSPSSVFPLISAVILLSLELPLLPSSSVRMTSAAGVGGDGSGRRCQEITVPICRGIGYNTTYMPNQFSHDTQDEAGLEVHQFYPLVEIKCSPDLRFFLCSMYVPICVHNYQKPLPACRSVCERARAGCAPVMQQYGFTWPERMRCEDFPEYGDKHRLCMDVNNTGSSSSASSFSSSSSSFTGSRGTGSNGGGAMYQPGDNRGSQSGVNRFPPLASPDAGRSDSGSSLCPCRDCPVPLVAITDSSNRLYDRVSTGGLANCAVPCDGLHFGDDERRFARIWIGIWSALCVVSTAATLATFAVDRRRFRYPERAIVLLSACYLFVAIGYIVGVLVDRESVSCERHVTLAAQVVDDSNENVAMSGRQQQQQQPGLAQRTDLIVRYYSTGPVGCTIVFLLVYFFGMAACLWWVVLTFTWFLSAGLKWSHEAIAANAQYFHFVAWLIPAVQSIAALAMSAVDGDPLSGICYVGGQDVAALRGFVLGPLCAYLIVGTCFLVAGFVAMFRIRRTIRRQQQQQQQLAGVTSSVTSSGVAVVSSDKLDRFMVRIGVVSVLYTVPASTVVACLFYEQHYRESWDRSRVCHGCASAGGQTILGGGGSTLPSPGPIDRPDFSVFALKYFACIVVGITSGFWIWTRKTIESWRARCCYGGEGCCCCMCVTDGSGRKAAAKMAAVDARGCYDEVGTLRPSVVVAANGGGKAFSAGAGSSVPYPCSERKHHFKPEISLMQHQQLAVEGLKTPSLYSQL